MGAETGAGAAVVPAVDRAEAGASAEEGARGAPQLRQLSLWGSEGCDSVAWLRPTVDQRQVPAFRINNR